MLRIYPVLLDLVRTLSPQLHALERREPDLNWYDLYAFCLWDGGFLPSEAEWQYASAGGAENRRYAWGMNDPEANAALAVYGCYWNGTGGWSCSGRTNIAPVGSVPAGNGRWGQSDLAGSVFEWTLDWYTNPYPANTCSDCANTTSASYRMARGGSAFYLDASYLTSANRSHDPPAHRSYAAAGRCARSAP